MVVSDTREHFIKRCDQALYQAKTNGRNRVEVL
jgi:PleD family two-component response regulator